MRSLEEQFFTVWLFFQISSSWGIINLQKRSLACFLSFLISLLFSTFCWFGQWADWKVYREEDGNQRGDSSQRTEQRGFGYGLCCHWNKQGKVSKRETLANMIISDWKPQTLGLWCAADPERPTMWNTLMTWAYLSLLFKNLFWTMNSLLITLW